MTSYPVWCLRHQIRLAVTGKRNENWKIRLHQFVRLCLKIVCADLHENQTKFGTRENIERFLTKSKMAVKVLWWRENLLKILKGDNPQYQQTENLLLNPHTSREISKNAILLITAPPSGRTAPNLVCLLQTESWGIWPNLVFESKSMSEILRNFLFGGFVADGDGLASKVGISYGWGTPQYLWMSQSHFKNEVIKRYEQKQCFSNYSAP